MVADESPASSDRSVAAAFARALRAAGVRRVYGLPGEDHLRLLDAFGAEGVDYVGARDETAAAIMAAAEAQATGLPGVVLVTIAPGLTNAVNGIAHAWLDGVPLLVVCGQHAPERAPMIVRQRLDNHALVGSITRWTVTASARIHQTLARALDIALGPPAGPVLLELRDDVAALPALDAPETWPALTHASIPPSTVSVDAFPLAVRTAIAAARRPVVIVGGNCPADARTHAALRSFAATLRAPVFCSPSAMGMTCPDDPWHAGTFMNGNLEADLLSRADLVLVVGVDAKDFFNAPWRYAVPVVSINPRPDTQRFIPTSHQLIGDPAALLAALPASSSDWGDDDVAAYRRHVEAPFALADDALTIPSALRALRELLPADTLVAVDAGFGKPLTSYLWSAPAPGHYFTAHGLSTMGYALPAANALQLAFPDRPVLGLMGDGSLLMRASEISVAAEHGIAPIYVAWMDGALSQIETKQQRQSLRTVGARLPTLSCAKIAEAFGGIGTDVCTLEDFKDAVTRAQSRRTQPTLIGARIDQSQRTAWYELLRG